MLWKTGGFDSLSKSNLFHKFEGRENYQKHRGSLNIGDWSIQSRDWESPRGAPRVKFEEAQKSYIKNREGTIKEIFGGYCIKS